MKTYINKTVIVGAVASLAGLFIYKQYVERHVVKAVGGAE